MNHDLTKLAAEIRQAHSQGRSLCLPAMTVRELGILARLLDTPLAPSSPLLH